jgi:penicillin-binding protein 2
VSKYSDEAQDFPWRVSAIRAVAMCILALLAVRFWMIQVVEHDLYLAESERNRIRDIPIPAPRGNILDRNGRILVDSRPSFSLKVHREDLRGHDLDALLGTLQASLGVDPGYAKQQLNDPTAPKSRPITVKQNLTEGDRAWVEAHELEYPELHVEPEPQRSYPLGKTLAHVLGYVAQISPDQLHAEPAIPEFEGARSGDVVGQAGIERSHNQLLMGREGSQRVVVDSAGRTVEVLERIEPIPGQDLYTTIDLDLQTIAEEQLAATGLKGAVVVEDPRNGQILAMVSNPAYDPNEFSGGISRENYAKLATDPGKPLRNRVIQDIYPPGSTWKLVMAMAGLSEHAMRWDESIPCGGGIQIGNRFAACDGFHGAPSVEHAITVSCNGYFYRVGLRLGVDKINKWATAMGLGKRTGVDLPNETAGYVPDGRIKLRWKLKNRPNDDDPAYRWTESDTVNAAIGQGYDRPTPIQMVHAYAGIGMNGHFTTPHLLLRAAPNAIRPEVLFEDPNVVDLPLDPVAYEHVMNGLRGVVTSGTARRADVPGFDVCGKTGTAQVVSQRTGASGAFREHAWFCCFAPKPDPTIGREPEIACVVLCENGGHGGVESAPIAKAIITAYAQKTHPEMLQGADASPAAGGDADPDTAIRTDASDSADDGSADQQEPAEEAVASPSIVERAGDSASSDGNDADSEPHAPLLNPLQGVMRSTEPPATAAHKRTNGRE